MRRSEERAIQSRYTPLVRNLGCGLDLREILNEHRGIISGGGFYTLVTSFERHVASKQQIAFLDLFLFERGTGSEQLLIYLSFVSQKAHFAPHACNHDVCFLKSHSVFENVSPYERHIFI